MFFLSLFNEYGPVKEEHYVQPVIVFWFISECDISCIQLHEQVLSNNLFVPDHSHFQLIVDQVKKAVAERKQNLETDDLDGLLEDPEEVPPETDASLLFFSLVF